MQRYEQGLITRRYVFHQNPDNTLYRRDVAFSLEKISRAKIKNKDFDGARQALVESLGLRQELMKRDDSQNLWLLEYADTLQQMAACVLASGKAEDIEVAAGYYALASDNEKLQKIAGDKDARAIKLIASANAQYTATISKLRPETLAAKPDPVKRKARFKDEAANAMGIEIARQQESAEIDPVSDWNSYLATLMEQNTSETAQDN